MKFNCHKKTFVRAEFIHKHYFLGQIKKCKKIFNHPQVSTSNPILLNEEEQEQYLEKTRHFEFHTLQKEQQNVWPLLHCKIDHMQPTTILLFCHG